jgi:8-oxo-dGTP diphosphatase
MTRTLMQPLAADAARHSRHFQLIVDIHLLLVSNGDLLLGRRANTGYGDGAYEPPSERLAERETLVEAAVRVAASQVGIAVDPAEVSLAHVLHDVSGHGRMAFFLTADGWAGEPGAVPPGSVPSGPVPSGPVPSGPVPSGPVPSGPVPSGPVPSGTGPALPGTRSYSDFGWYPLTDLPANMIDRARVAVRNYAAGARFSTYPAFGM